MTLRVLPRSLDPLPLESLPGYLLRLAHRLDLPPLRIAALTGLIPPQGTAVPASRLFALEPAMAETFSRTTRLSTTEVTALTLTRFSDRYPPLDPQFSGRKRLIHGIFVKENWVFFRASRYCPECLAGDGSTIQQRYGGAWNLLWRLPVVFACPTHQRLLEHACPTCHQPAFHRVKAQSNKLLPLAAHTGLHPAQCRTTIRDRDKKNLILIRACGTQLDQATHADQHLDADAALADLQTRLLNLLHPGGPTATASVGQDTTPQRYFVDLRILACLIAASWPTGRDLIAHPHQARLLDQHIRSLRRQMTSIRKSGRTVRELSFYDRPPLEAVTCACLLATADRIVTLGATDTVRDLLEPLVAHAPAGMRNWTRQFLAGDGYCSPGLHAALGLAIGAPHVMKRAGIPRRVLTPPPQPVQFGVQHIPQYLLPQWYERHFACFATQVKPRLLRRAAAALLAQICVGGPAADAAESLGIPRLAADNALTVVRDQISTKDRRAFHASIDTLADHLNTNPDLTDYGTRREALKDWSIGPEKWAALTTGLRDDSISARRGRWGAYIDWDDQKRILASIWVWVRITAGEHLFAPAIRPDLSQRRPSGRPRRGIHNRWPHISAEHPRGHYAVLRGRLDAYADLLTNEIDNHEHRLPTNS